MKPRRYSRREFIKLYLVTSPLIWKPVLQPMPVKEWSLPGLNEGHA